MKAQKEILETSRQAVAVYICSSFFCNTRTTHETHNRNILYTNITVNFRLNKPLTDNKQQVRLLFNEWEQLYVFQYLLCVPIIATKDVTTI